MRRRGNGGKKKGYSSFETHVEQVSLAGTLKSITSTITATNNMGRRKQHRPKRAQDEQDEEHRHDTFRIAQSDKFSRL